MDEENYDETEQSVASANADRKEDTVDDLNYDLYNLTAKNMHPLVWKNDNERESVILSATLRAARLLYAK